MPSLTPSLLRAPRARKPAALRGGLIGQLEPVFTTVLTLSFLAHAVATVTLFQVEPPPPPTTAQVNELWERIKGPPVVLARAQTPKPDDEAKPVHTSPSPRPRPKPTPPADAPALAVGTPRGSPRLNAGEVATAVRQRAAAFLTQVAVAGEGGGDIADLVAIGAGDLTTHLDGRGVRAARAGEGVHRVTGDDRAVSLGEEGSDLRSTLLGDRGPGRVATGKKERTALTPVVSSEALETTSGKIDAKKVARVLRSRASAFQACYEAELKTDSKLGGKLGIEMTIDGAGRVAEVVVAEDQLGSAAVERCVKRELRRLRMPTPDGDEVVVAYAFVFSAR